MESESQTSKEGNGWDGELTGFLEKRKTDSCEERESEGRLAHPAKPGKATKSFLKRVPLRVKACAVAAILVLACLVLGVVLPLAIAPDEPAIVTVESLKSAVDIGDLEVVDYTYRGIAEKKSQFLWVENVDYRVRYEAHVRASYDMSTIEFYVNDESKTITASLPDVKISEPVPDETTFGYLPENARADVRDVIAICKEDVENELNREWLRTEASENVQETVKALTRPLLPDGWHCEFKDASTKDQPDREVLRNEGK